MGPIDCPETSVWNYHSTLRKIREERISQLESMSNEAKVAYLYPPLLCLCRGTENYSKNLKE